MSVLSSETNNDGSGVSEGHLRDHLGPATQWWALEMEKEKHASKEALNEARACRVLLGSTLVASKNGSSGFWGSKG